MRVFGRVEGRGGKDGDCVVGRRREEKDWAVRGKKGVRIGLCLVMGGGG